eukprot:scaffold47381_cov36-Prasinocladus_malaysianus.AAC.1
MFPQTPNYMILRHRGIVHELCVAICHCHKAGSQHEEAYEATIPISHLGFLGQPGSAQGEVQRRGQ